jgi:aspartate/tyrosine/aromatic aminotransferase
MFERLEPVTADTILSLMAAYRADPDPRKVDLGIGVYRDERGNTPVPQAVRRAERALIEAQTAACRHRAAAARCDSARS